MHMSKNSLEVLFESRTRLKILKFLFRNLDKQYTLREIVSHTQEDPSAVRNEVTKLAEINLLTKGVRKHAKKEQNTIEE